MDGGKRNWLPAVDGNPAGIPVHISIRAAVVHGSRNTFSIEIFCIANTPWGGSGSVKENVAVEDGARSAVVVPVTGTSKVDVGRSGGVEYVTVCKGF